MRDCLFRKGLIIGIIVLFFGTGIGAGLDKIEYKNNEKNLLSQDDELDQQQTFNDMVVPFGYDPENDINCAFAQSFTPQKNILTRVYLFIYRWKEPYPFDLAIRKKLNGKNLTTASVNYNQIPSLSYAWIEFNFDDIPVIAGEEYYIVISTQSIYPDAYGVGGGTENPYPNGELWETFYWQQWYKWPAEDLCFKTYGKYNNVPNKPDTPSGPTSGTTGTPYPYQTSVIDLDGEKVEYGWDWTGNGVVDQWDNNGGNYYTSGVPITTSHSWPLQGTYNVKVVAKDINGAQGPWSDPLSVTMPRNRPIINSPFQRFLQNHPYLFPILRHLLRL
jgi:hypothetical protein